MTRDGNMHNTVRQSAAAVKGRIVSHGIRMTDLARAAGIAAPTLSAYLAGRRRDPRRRRDIYIAFRCLSGSNMSESEFWASANSAA
jgi:transcriptional regulator with XRE-family HTH domain